MILYMNHELIQSQIPDKIKLFHQSGVVGMSEKKQLTVRLPAPVVDYLATKASEENKTLNDVMIEVTEQYMNTAKSEKLIREIAIVRERAKEITGTQPDSVDDIRRFREGDK